MKKGPFKLKPKNKFDFGNKGKFNFNKTNDYSKKKKYPKSYTKEDIKFLEDQREDVVREEDKN
tara:strand:+ start:41 stop:229 length:189 start_codon:yes stop_codon:yes gene_type:complete